MSLAVTLASTSKSRRALLAAAGVEAESAAPNVDEEAFRNAMRANRLPVREQAMQLAELKAMRVSAQRPGLVIGGDQMLALGDQAFDKPADLEAAKNHLRQLSGKSHTLETAIVVCEDGAPVWRHLARPKLTMRPLTEEFIETYVSACGDALLSTVGAYQLEGLGAQLFARIEGDYFSILGLPLLPLLDYLRIRKVLPT
ncbi:MAG: septum formation protein Maf [Hyphomonas sp.]|uniref:Maf family protein n=1 Tax=Hyphomonas sp. TaxID=87 RepID=UPI001D601D5E|nr:Maf family protein [Hyphomonas sp.]MBA4225468.1 septum formation protein Maf [Hyphomonas sp.]